MSDAVVRRAARKGADGDVPDPGGPADAGRDRTLARVVVVVSLLAVVSTRAWQISQKGMPIGPDPLGPWANAFRIAGADPAIDASGIPSYSVGMGTVLAPLVHLVEDPLLRQRVALSLGALSILPAAWLVTRFLRRAMDPGPLGLAAAFAVATLLPSATVNLVGTWSEPLVFLWVAAVLAAGAWAFADYTVARAAALAALCALGPLVHSRLLLVTPWLLALALAYMVTDLRRGSARRESLATFAGAVLSAAVVTVATVQYRDWVLSGIGEAAAEAGFVDDMVSVDFWVGAAKALVGQSWYLLASTAGLAGLGIVALAVSIRPTTGDGSPRRAWTAAFALGAMGAAVAPGVLNVAGGPGLINDPPLRLDYLVYGRYAEPVVVYLAAVGAAVWLLRRPVGLRVYAVAVGLIPVLGLVVKWVRDSYPHLEIPFLDSMSTGVTTWPSTRPGLDIVRWTLMAVALGLVLLGSRALGRRTAGITLVVLLLAGTAHATYWVDQRGTRYGYSELYEGYPDAPETNPRMVAPAELLTDQAYRFSSPGQQYVLAAQGWTLDYVETSPEELVALPPEDAGILVAWWDTPAPAGEWCLLPPYSRVRLWARLGDGIDGTAGEPCPIGDSTP